MTRFLKAMKQNTKRLVKCHLVVPPQEGKETSGFDGLLKTILRCNQHYGLSPITGAEVLLRTKRLKLTFCTF